jgi:DNA polymerase elongation subunit (family B)
MTENKEINRLVEEFLSRKYMLDMGKNKLAKYLKTTPENILIAKKLAKLQSRAALAKDNSAKLPKILIFDIETSPLEAYVYQKSVWKANIGPEKIISPWYTITWSAKWLFSDYVMSDRLTSEEATNEDDSRITKSLWNLFDEADILIAHNGDGFDIPNMNTRFLVNGLTPPSPYQRIDTLKVARKEFGFTHNGLDALAGTLGLQGKIQTNFDLWKRCKRGEDAALIEMETYNIQDVRLLEEVYLELRPWIRSHPSAALFIESEEMVCPACGHSHLEQRGFYLTQVSKFETYQCQNSKCGAYSRARKSIVPDKIKKNLLVSISR